jgi:hypothetical protein
MYTPHIHWLTRGTGTPKVRDEVNRGEVFEKPRFEKPGLRFLKPLSN